MTFSGRARGPEAKLIIMPMPGSDETKKEDGMNQVQFSRC